MSRSVIAIAGLSATMRSGWACAVAFAGFVGIADGEGERSQLAVTASPTSRRSAVATERRRALSVNQESETSR
jgi:hypothetical protein